MISSTLHHLAFGYVENHVESEQGKLLHLFLVLNDLKEQQIISSSLFFRFLPLTMTMNAFPYLKISFLLRLFLPHVFQLITEHFSDKLLI